MPIHADCRTVVESRVNAGRMRSATLHGPLHVFNTRYTMIALHCGSFDDVQCIISLNIGPIPMGWDCEFGMFGESCKTGQFLKTPPKPEDLGPCP